MILCTTVTFFAEHSSAYIPLLILCILIIGTLVIHIDNQLPVYVTEYTEYSEYHHTKDCPTIKNSNSKKLKLKEAKEDYSQCEICLPEKED